MSGNQQPTESPSQSAPQRILPHQVPLLPWTTWLQDGPATAWPARRNVDHILSAGVWDTPEQDASAHVFTRRKRSRGDSASASASANDGGRSRQPLLISRSQLEESFHLPLKDAALKFGVSTTALKSVCRKVLCWPPTNDCAQTGGY
jgi:hypothetical protein